MMQNSRRYLPIVLVLILLTAAVIAVVFLNGGGALAGLTQGVTIRENTAQLLSARLSPDGNRAAIDVNGSPAQQPNELRMVDTSSGRTLWSVTEDRIEFPYQLYAVNTASGAVTEAIDFGLGQYPDSFAVSTDGSVMAVLRRDSLHVWR
jgi:hypothetical protein